jgi:enoyl-[acyl-carrier protein] reductase I
MGFLDGKKALVVGVASNRSIAWGIAEAMAKQGCEIALTYQNEKLKKRVDKCAAVCNSNIVIECDVASDKGIDQTFKALKNHWDNFDILVHSVAFAPREALDGNYIDATTRENFATAHDISNRGRSNTKLCDKRDGFTFLKVNSPFIISNMLAA